MRVRGAIGLLIACLAWTPGAAAREIDERDWEPAGPGLKVRDDRLSLPLPNTIAAEIRTRMLREVTLRFADGCGLTGTLLLDGGRLKDFSVPAKGRTLGLSAKADTGTHEVALRLEPAERCPRGRAVMESSKFREWVPIGSDLGSDHIADEAYAALVAKHADSVTAGTDMQWNAIEPAPGAFDFAAADSVVDFADQAGIEARGHPLVWRFFVPEYARSRDNGPEELAAIMRTHIYGVVGRYRESVDEWDVVNEVVSDSGGLRNTFWRRTLGRGYIALALHYARDADPDARLFINEYGAEVEGPKANTYYRVASRILAAGVPLDGVGFQYHYSTNGWPDRKQMQENLQRFADLGLAVQITEADVIDETEHPGSGHRRGLQRDAFAAAARACKKVIACERFTMWGLSDRYSWLGAERQPLPFDERLDPKPSWPEIKRILRPKG